MSDFTPSLVTPQPCPPTLKIADADTPDGYVIINASDFDAEAMTVYGAEPKAKRSAKSAE